MSGPPLPPRPPQQSGFQGNPQSGSLQDPGNYVAYNDGKFSAQGILPVNNQLTMLKRQTSAFNGFPGSSTTLSRTDEPSMRANLRRCDSQLTTKSSRSTVTRNSAKSSYPGLTDVAVTMSSADSVRTDDAPPLPDRGSRPPLPAPNKTGKNSGIVLSKPHANEIPASATTTLKPNRSDSNFSMHPAWNDIPNEQPPLPPPTGTRILMLPESVEPPVLKSQMNLGARFVFRTSNEFPPPRPFIPTTKTYSSRRNRAANVLMPDNYATTARR